MKNAIIVIGGVAAAAGAVFSMLPEIRRYLKMRSM
jgi:Family of unknown function (DUF6893)